MLVRRTGILVFPASSYDAAHEIAGRLLDAGFPRAALVVEQSGDDDYEVTLHTNEANQGRAERAVYGNGYLGKLAVAGAVLAVGGALWSLWNNYSETYQARRERQRRYGYRERARTMGADVASTRLRDTNPPGSMRPIETRDREAVEAGAMPIS